jgi:hypothetical protein
MTTMSEYQYYEFRSIDRPLNQREMDELREWSTRAEITPTSLTNTYHYGDFRGNPETLVERYFDAFVYVANWGTHQLMFRIPRSLLDPKSAALYGAEDALSIKVKAKHVLIEFLSNDEGGGWVDGEPFMPELIGLRAELIRGDLRVLYLGWLSSLRERYGYDEDALEEARDALESPVPPGLGKLSAPLKALAEFLRVEGELIEVAAQGSAGDVPSEPSRAALERWIKKLPAAEKNEYLLRFLAEDGDILLRSELRRRYVEATQPKQPRPAGTRRRTAAQLLAACDARIAEKQRRKAKRAARR